MNHSQNIFEMKKFPFFKNENEIAELSDILDKMFRRVALTEEETNILQKWEAKSKRNNRLLNDLLNIKKSWHHKIFQRIFRPDHREKVWKKIFPGLK
jgi:hypothetical protein